MIPRAVEAITDDIYRLVKAFHCNYERLAELEEELCSTSNSYNSYLKKESPYFEMSEYRLKELQSEFDELKKASDNCRDKEEARDQIRAFAKYIRVRSDWTVPGDELVATEFCVWLDEDVRIRGERTEFGTACKAWIEHREAGKGVKYKLAIQEKYLLEFVSQLEFF
jgi:hypothetical protein